METTLDLSERSPFTGAVELTQHVSPGAVTQDPGDIYLKTLDSKESRRKQDESLKIIARMVHAAVHGARDPKAPPIPRDGFPWWLLRYEHTTYIRSLLIDREPSYAPATINRHLSALRGVLEECWNMRLMATDEYTRAIKIKTVKGTREPAGREIGNDEIADMLAACAQSDGPIRYRDTALIAVLESTGTRRAEIASMRIEKYDQRSRTIRVIGKGNKERLVFVHKDAAPHLDRWLAMLGTRDGPIFPPINRGGQIYKDRHMSPEAVWQIVQKRRTQAGVAPLSTHDFRRTFGDEYLDSGGDVVQLQRLFGHASVATTASYDRRGERGLRDAVDRMNIVLPKEGGTAGEVEAP